MTALSTIGHVCNAGCRDGVHCDVTYGPPGRTPYSARAGLQIGAVLLGLPFEVIEAAYAPEAPPASVFMRMHPERAAWWASHGFVPDDNLAGYRYTFRSLDRPVPA